MFGTRIKLFKLLGFEVRIDLSWLLIAALIVWSLASGLFPYYYEGLSRSTYWIMGVIGALGLFASIIVHEFSHSLIARRFGLPMKGITLFVFGGVAEMNEEPPSAKAEFFMAIAGPIASILIGGALLGILAVLPREMFPTPTWGVLQYLGTINLILAAFNLIPAFPLDGGRVLRAALWAWKKNLRWATWVASKLGSGFGWFLVFLGVLNIFSGGFVGGLWWILLGLFVRSASHMSYQRMLIRKALAGEPVRRFLHPDPISVPPEVTLEEFVDRYVYRFHHKMFPVNDNGHLSCITTQDVKQLPRDQWGKHTVGETAKPCSDENTVRSEADAVDVLASMNSTGSTRMLVRDDEGHLAGIITLKDLLRFLSLKLDLENQDEAMNQIRSEIERQDKEKTEV